MDESTLSYLSIQFSRSHTSRLLIASLTPQWWQSQALFLAQKFLYVYVFECWVCGHPHPWQKAAFAGNPLYATALFSSSSHFGKGLVSRRWYMETAATTTLWLLTSPTLDPWIKSSMDKGVATLKSLSGERCTIRSRRGQPYPNSLLMRMGIF